MDLSGSWEYITSIARSRLANNITPHHIAELGDRIEIIGVAGEICARRFLGLNEKVHTHFDGGTDINYHGIRIDVKATKLTSKLSHRFLQWPTGKNVKAPIILLTAIDEDRKIGTVMGYLTKDEILEAPINRERTYPCREVPVTSLHPCWELLEMFERSLYVRNYALP